MVAVERWAFLTRRAAPAEIEGLANPQLEPSSNRAEIEAALSIASLIQPHHFEAALKAG